MPQNSKDTEKNTKVKKTVNAKKSTSKETTSAVKNKSNTKDSSAKKAVAENKSTSSKKTATKEAKKVTAKKASNSKKVATTKKNVSTRKKATTSNKNASNVKMASIEKKATTTKKATGTTKKSTTIKRASKKVAIPVEYYDLPVAYNKTVVKILAQTPYCLFVYWEISEKDKLKFQEQYGNGFFQNTKPYLVITNETMNYSFETEINDYANSWYIHIHDSDCEYSVRLIRKPINLEVSITSSVDIISSNEINAPNDHILFDKLGKTVFFKNVKTNIMSKKDISSISFISNIGKIYNIYDLYKEIYKNELDDDKLGIGISSSQFSSFFK